MTEHRTISIGGVVINEVNITELANDLHEAFGFDREKGEFDYFSRRYEVKLENDISRSDRNPEILSNSFKTEIVKSVEIVTCPQMLCQCEVSFSLFRHWLPAVGYVLLAPVVGMPVSCVA